jgi:hypothetical protein
MARIAVELRSISIPFSFLPDLPSSQVVFTTMVLSGMMRKRKLLAVGLSPPFEDA